MRRILGVLAVVGLVALVAVKLEALPELRQAQTNDSFA